MRLTIVAGLILLLSGLASAQANIIGGTASDWAPPFIYAAPFVPLLTTPSASWGPAMPASAGARNATWGNVAGARNSTFETLPEESNEHRWGGFREERMVREVRHEGPGMMEPEMRHEAREEHARPFRSGMASSEFGQGLAELMGKSSTATKASRTYTNQDASRMNDANGTVKYRGKTEHI